MNVSLTSKLGLLYTNAFTVLREKGFVFQHVLTLILGFNGLIPKNYCLLNSCRNARITTIFEFVDKLDFTYYIIFQVGNYEF